MKKFMLLVVVFLLLVVAVISCSSSEEEGIGFATYNAGLAIGFVDYASQRQPEIVSALALEKADVICMQEVWNQEQIDAIINGTKEVYPYSYYEITDGSNGEEEEESTEASCTKEETDPLAACVDTNCDGVEPENIGSCVMTYCTEEFLGLSQSCSDCAVSELGKPVEEIIGNCTTSAGGSWAYDGHNGLLMLSKIPFAKKEFMTFDSYLNVRSVLHTTLETDQFGSMELFCTHLTANLSKVNYAGDYESWEGERAVQIDELLKYVEDKSGKTRPSVVMGDMNCGPETDNVNAEYADNYTKFVDGGLRAPYVEYELSPCTWCGSNPLIDGGADAGGEDSIIDHVMFKYMPETASYATDRIMDQAITITDDEDAEIETRLSDHYGVEVIAIP